MRRMQSYVRPVRVMLAAGVAAGVLQAVMQWLAPWPLKLIFDTVLGHHKAPGWLAGLAPSRGGRLDALAIAMLVIAVLLGLFAYLSNRLVAIAGQRVVYDLRCELFRHLEAQSVGFHQRRSTGDLMSRLSGDTQAIQNLAVNAVPTFVNNVLTLAGMVVIMAIVDWRFTLLALALIPLVMLTSWYYLRRIKAAERHARRLEGIANGAAQEVLTSLPVVQAFGTEQAEAERFSAITGEGLHAARRSVLLQSEFTPLVTATMAAATVLVIFFGSRSVISGRLTPGDLLVFSAYLRGMYTPVRQLAKLANVVGRAQAATERVFEILDASEEVPERPGAKRPARVKGHLCFEGIGVSYDGEHDVIAGVDLEIAPGHRLALVGATGSGKSSLLRLVPRFLDPSHGVLRLDGVDVRDLTLDGLRRQVALVPQEAYTFQASVWENIVYGAPVASREAAIAAAHAAGVFDVIAALPDGFETLVAERGSTLSGGQRQCLAVARAMARDAPILLLDEPTTGLDAQAEATLVQALDRLAAGRTTIIVSHQLQTVRQADSIAMLASGRITEMGTHQQLVRSRRAYWRLHDLQQGPASPTPPDRDRPTHTLKTGSPPAARPERRSSWTPARES